MQRIVVDPLQGELIRKAGRSIQVLDTGGKIVGYITPAPPENEIERVEEWLVAHRDAPVYTTQWVFERLRSIGK